MLANIKLKNPIEQQMMGRAGLFRQQNIEKRKVMSVREWAELCAKDELRAPGVDDIGLHARATNGTARARTRKGRRKTRDSETAEPEMTPGVMVKEEDEDHVGVSIGPIVDEEDETGVDKQLASPPPTADSGPTPVPVDGDGEAEHEEEPSAEDHPDTPPTTSHEASILQTPPAEDVKDEDEKKPKTKGRRNPHNKEARGAALAERTAKDEAFLDKFDTKTDWLPPKTNSTDYTPEFCKELERRYWRTCGLGRSAWYGADMQGR